MTTLAHFLAQHPLLTIATIWSIGGCAFAWFEYKAGIE